ncbi:unnamed protein product [Cylicocyclus nassatus]|uniref:Transmembrane protein 188 n=1 Tax=Cylicocyclus nassatus TaxID=53992 RepID=A0AA36GQ41_CYLNA|nr:unnamed protein product [Cylicocyclus nassatus]
MDDAATACEDLKFFERRLTEVISHLGPRCTRWRIVLLLISLSAVLTSYNWIADPTLRTVSLWESLQSHPVFSVSVPLLFILFTAFGIHRRVVEPSIIARRCRESLSYFSLSCDDNGKLIVKPTVRMSSP